jgi:hypothetical protein
MVHLSRAWVKLHPGGGTLGVMLKMPKREPLEHWAGNRYSWWRLLSTIGWMSGVVSFPGVPDVPSAPTEAATDTVTSRARRLVLEINKRMRPLPPGAIPPEVLQMWVDEMRGD